MNTTYTASNNMYLHIFTPVVIGAFMNFAIYFFKINGRTASQQNKNKWIPPSYVIGFVWLVLLGCMGMAHYLLSITTAATSYYGIYCIDFLIAFCILYPLFTRLKDNDYFFLSLSLFITLFTALVVKIYSYSAFLYLVPVIAWVVYVNIATYLGS